MKMIDPPSGWRFGFPKAIPDDVEFGNYIKWMVENGYPQSEVDKYGEYFIYRIWEVENEN
jgi:hypothetical protein